MSSLILYGQKFRCTCVFNVRYIKTAELILLKFEMEIDSTMAVIIFYVINILKSTY